jgi:hypothetical protein
MTPALEYLVLIYLDYTFIFSKDTEKLLEHTMRVLYNMRNETLLLQTKKCHFFQSEVNFLGHIMSRSGIGPEPEKVQAVADWLEPQNQTQVRSFLGLTTYFKRFIKGYAKIAAPLMELTKEQYKTQFQLTPGAQHAFHELMRMLISAPILQVPDFRKPFKLIIDAINVGLRGVII